MSTHEQLKVFQKSYDFFVTYMAEMHKFPKEYRFGLGKTMESIYLKFLSCIIEANATTDKKPYQKEANICLEQTRIYIRLCKDLKIISSKKYINLCKRVDEIGRMLGGWIKSS